MYQNMYNQGMAEPQAYNPYDENAKIIKGFLSKPIVLVAAIIFAVSAVVTVINSIIGNNFTNLNINYSYTYGETSSVVNLSWLAAIPTLFYVLGFLLMFFKSKSPSPSSKPNAGATINWIVSIIMLILVCLLTLFFIVILFLAGTLFNDDFFREAIRYYQYYYNYSYSTVKSMFDSFLLIIGVVFSLAMLYIIILYAHRVRFYGAIRNGLNTAYLSKRGATAYGVMSIISVVFYAVMIVIAVSSVVSSTPYRVDISPMFYITAAINLIAPIIEAVFAIKYASYIRPYMERQAVGNFSGMNFAPQMNMGYSYQPTQQPYNSFNQGTQYSNPYSEPANNQDNAYQNPYYNQNVPQSQPQEPENNYSYESTPEPQADTRCPMCGTEHGPNDMFCGSCGARLK